MAKLLALTKIILPADEKHKEERVIPKRAIFDATPEQAKSLDALKAARPALAEEIAAAKEAQAIADGTAFISSSNSSEGQEIDAPPTAVDGDPKGIPKGKGA